LSTVIQQISIPGPAGTLEGILNLPDERNGEVAIVCHPHPLHGGTMHTHVVFHIAKALRERGFAVLRFNFRGVGRSTGSYDEGRGEQDDVRAALEFMSARYPDAPVLMAGFSFGSVMATKVSQTDPRVHACIAVGLPVHERPTAYLSEVRKPLYVIQGGGDPYGSPAQVQQALRQVPALYELHEIPQGEHFFNEQLSTLRAAVSAAVDWYVEVRIPRGE
jgi:uncharacterized protein